MSGAFWLKRAAAFLGLYDLGCVRAVRHSHHAGWQTRGREGRVLNSRQGSVVRIELLAGDRSIGDRYSRTHGDVAVDDALGAEVDCGAIQAADGDVGAIGRIVRAA